VYYYRLVRALDWYVLVCYQSYILHINLQVINYIAYMVGYRWPTKKGKKKRKKEEVIHEYQYRNILQSYHISHIHTTFVSRTQKNSFSRDRDGEYTKMTAELIAPTG
jgi:hypothetical protein